MNPVKPTEYFFCSSNYNIAYKSNIHIIVQGENNTLTLGVELSDVVTGDDAFHVTEDNTLRSGLSTLGAYECIAIKDLYFLQFPSNEEMVSKKSENFTNIVLESGLK